MSAEDAVNFHTSILEDSTIVNVMYYGDAVPGPKGSVLSITFRLNGQEFIALNGGPHFTFSPAISFFVKCNSQEEIDGLWEKLSEAARPSDAGGCEGLTEANRLLAPSLHGPRLDRRRETVYFALELINRMVNKDGY